MYIGILFYTAIWMLSYIIVYYHYTRCRAMARRNQDYDMEYTYRKKMPVVSMLIISLLFTLFNVYSTKSSDFVGGDRQNYIINFMGYRDTPSVGLSFVIKMIHMFGGSVESLFYFTTFVNVFITLIAYRLSKKAKPYTFYLLCITQYFLATLTALKQCYASSFAVLFFVLLLEYDTKKSRIAALICAILACLFHPTGYILFILYFVVKMEKKTKKTIALYFMLIFFVGIFFERIMPIVATIVSPILPSLGGKILQYFSEESVQLQDGSIISFFKGFPYYFIVFLGLYYRKWARNFIKHYDEYLIIAGMGAFLYLMSLYSYWFGRFIYFFSFVSFVFFAQLLNVVKIQGNRMIYSLIVQGSLLVVTYRFLYMIYALYGGF